MKAEDAMKLSMMHRAFSDNKESSGPSTNSAGTEKVAPFSYLSALYIFIFLGSISPVFT